MQRFDTNLRASVAFIALVGAATAAEAQSPQPTPSQTAQAAAAPENEIVITGSRIRRNPLDLDAPRVFVDQADIQKTGLNAINDVLQRLPSSGGGVNSKFNNSGNLGNPPSGGGVGAGSAQIDLRYLDPIRTLVLVDGLRFVNGSSASGIPAHLPAPMPGLTPLNSRLRVTGRVLPLIVRSPVIVYWSCPDGSTVVVVTWEEAQAAWYA